MLFWQTLEYVPRVADLFEQARNSPNFQNLTHTRRLVELHKGRLRFPLASPDAQYSCDERYVPGGDDDTPLFILLCFAWANGVNAQQLE